MVTCSFYSYDISLGALEGVCPSHIRLRCTQLSASPCGLHSIPRLPLLLSSHPYVKTVDRDNGDGDGDGEMKKIKMKKGRRRGGS